MSAVLDNTARERKDWEQTDIYSSWQMPHMIVDITISPQVDHFTWQRELLSCWFTTDIRAKKEDEGNQRQFVVYSSDQAHKHQRNVI